jgi:hypothetical protein
MRWFLPRLLAAVLGGAGSSLVVAAPASPVIGSTASVMNVTNNRVTLLVGLVLLDPCLVVTEEGCWLEVHRWVA